MELSDIAKEIQKAQENIFFIYAFNTTGKTRLSIEYKENARNNDGKQTGVYYNAFSEDLFLWDNELLKMKITNSSLNHFHSQISEKDIMEKLAPYNPKYEIKFEQIKDDNPELGFGAVYFYMKGDNEQKHIKISRGEEHIFTWCFFLALFEVDSWTGEQNDYFFIDDPVSSLDDHNIFITAFTLQQLIEKNYKNKKIIITTHHVGLATILCDWIKKGSTANRYSNGSTNKYKICFLENKDDNYKLESSRNGVVLYHLKLLQILYKAKKDESLELYHFVILRQVLENIASFLGAGQINYVLEQIGLADKKDTTMETINSLSHQKIYYPQLGVLVPDNKNTLIEVLEALKTKYNFVLHNN